MVPGPFPVDPLSLDKKMVTVIVGAETEWQTRTFAVHRSLLRLASASFEDELEYIPKGSQKKLELEDDCPMAFEVLYHWMYSGRVYDHTFYPTGTQTPDDLFWLEVYIFAGRRLLQNLQKESFLKLRHKFNGLCGEVPSLALLEELFCSECQDDCGDDSENPQKFLLKNYFLEHVAFWLVKTSKTDQWALWKHPMEFFRHDDSDFAEQVACKLAEWASDGQPFSNRRHPCYDPTYSDGETLTPPDQAISGCTEKHEETKGSDRPEEIETNSSFMLTQ